MAPPIQSVDEEYAQKSKFRVEVDGVAVGDFSKCSGIESTISVVKQREGGKAIAQKRPGTREFADVTLSRGQSKNNELWAWHDAANESVSSAGTVPTDLRTIAIINLRADGSEMKRWTLFRAWPSVYKSGELDADNDSENQIEEVTFTYEYAQLGVS